MAEHVADERVAILEMLEHRTLDHNPNGGLFYCKPELVEDLSFFYLKVKLHMRLVTLTAAPDALGLGANEETIYSDNYRVTREWARYIRKKVPDAKGIEYSPKRYRDTRAGVAMALFEDRLPKDSLELVGAPIPLVSDAGREIFLACRPFTRVLPAW
ncbi:hypothetical protein QE374_002786 [Microbacterium sp. SORGH_AS428]|nr:hypothetical protein [Microbacterium sp. SORGH_AS_0428]